MPERDFFMSLGSQLPFPDGAPIVARELTPPRRAVQLTFMPKHYDAVARLLNGLMDMRIEIIEVKTVDVTVKEEDVPQDT